MCIRMILLHCHLSSCRREVESRRLASKYVLQTQESFSSLSDCRRWLIVRYAAWSTSHESDRKSAIIEFKFKEMRWIGVLRLLPTSAEGGTSLSLEAIDSWTIDCGSRGIAVGNAPRSLCSLGKG